MPTGFGIPPDASGNGTTPEDIQLITAAKYENAGVLTGAHIWRRSDWKYEIRAGAVVLDTGPGMAVEVPVAGQVLSAPGTAGGPAATHTIYVRQNFPGTDGNSLAVVGITAGSAPSQSVVLDRFSVPAGANNTNAATSIYDRNYARMSGGDLGLLGTTLFSNPTSWSYAAMHTLGPVRVFIPTDRFLNIRLNSTVAHATPGGHSVNTELQSSMIYKIYIDNELRNSWEHSYGRIYETKQFETTLDVSAGAHNVHATFAMQFENPALPDQGRNWRVIHGGSERWPGNRMAVYDAGVRK